MENQCDIIQKYVCRANANVANQKECPHYLSVWGNSGFCNWQNYNGSLVGCNCKKARIEAEERGHQPDKS
jgi:hypothetical protein